MSQIPKVKTSLPKPSLSQIATATGSQLDLYAGRVNQTPKVPEPTESFKIGDKIWVGGTKQGTVKYIGDTKFAPGEWAGVELDAATGRHDRSVNAKRYSNILFVWPHKVTKSPKKAINPINNKNNLNKEKDQNDKT